jgi:hypothetical protein
MTSTMSKPSELPSAVPLEAGHEIPLPPYAGSEITPQQTPQPVEQMTYAVPAKRNAVDLKSLQERSAVVECPRCRTVEMSKVSYEVGNTTT